MKRVERMTRVAEIADERADAATVELADQVRGLAAAEAQLDELCRFRDEYGRNGSTSGIGIAELMNQRQFLQRLNEAIAYQRSELERRRHAIALERVRCSTARGRAKALDSVAQRLQHEEERSHERIEQSQADERSQRPRALWSED